MKRFLSIAVSLFFICSTFAQNTCSLNSFAYEIKPDGDIFYISITEPSDLHENYSVFVNQVIQEYDGVKFGPFEADCQTFYSLLVAQNNADACNVQANIGTICPETDLCRISEIEFSYPECNPNGVVFVELDFKHENVSDSFVVRGNGNHYGEFAYSDLPISVGPIVANCQKEYEFVVKDSDNEECKSVVENIRICCPINCTPPAFEIVSMTCSEGELSMKLVMNADIDNTNLLIKINEKNVEHFEVDLPYIYLKTTLPEDIAVNTLSVCTVGIADVCCFSQEFTTANCGSNDDCKIYDLRYEIPECQSNEEVFVLLDFKYKNPVSESFIVRGNGTEYGKFSYTDLPVQIGPFESACDVVYELVVFDSEADDCSAALEDLIICCHSGCLEPIFEIVSIACSNSKIEMKLELIHPLSSDALLITINDHVVEDFELDYPYLYLRSENSGAILNEISICTVTTTISECCYSHIFPLDCYPSNKCEIGGLEVVPTDCIDTSLPGFMIDFDYLNVGTKGFSLKGNGKDYGDFKYEDLPILVNVEEDCDLFYEFAVTDNEFECSSAVEYGHFCCSNNCSFRIRDTRVRCDGEFLTEVAFYLEEDTDPLKEYQVYVNGEFIGESDTNNGFLEFTTEIPIATGDAFELTVCDAECCVSEKLDLSNCTDPPQECEIRNVQTTGISCINSRLSFTLNFNHEGTNSTQFDVFSIFGYFGTFEYADLPIKIEEYPSVNLGLNVLFVCDKGSLCCQAHLFTAANCLSIGGGIKYVDDRLTQNNHRFIRQNPASSELILDSPFKNTVYQLMDNSGKLVKTLNSSDSVTREDISDLRSGLYIVRIEYKGEIKIEKLIITN